MLIKKRGRKPKNITVPLVKSGSPYGKIYKVVSSKSQKIKPTTKLEDTPTTMTYIKSGRQPKLKNTLYARISKVTIRGQNRTFRNQGRKK